MATPALGLPSWLQTQPIAPLAPIQSFLEGFQTGERAAAQQAAREQQAAQFSQELGMRQDAANREYQELAARLLHQQAMQKEAAMANQALQQHRLAQERQAQVTAQRLQEQNLAQREHWKAIEPKPPPTSVMAIPVLNPDNTPNLNLIATPSASGRGVVVRPLKNPVEGALTDTQKAKLRELDIAEREARDYRFSGDREKELENIRKQRNAVYGGKAPKRVRVRQKSTGNLGWWEFEGSETLPSDYEAVE